MMMHIKKKYANIIRLFTLEGSSLRVQGLSGINDLMMHVKKTYVNKEPARASSVGDTHDCIVTTSLNHIPIQNQWQLHENYPRGSILNLGLMRNVKHNDLQPTID